MIASQLDPPAVIATAVFLFALFIIATDGIRWWNRWRIKRDAYALAAQHGWHITRFEWTGDSEYGLLIEFQEIWPDDQHQPRHQARPDQFTPEGLQ